MEHHVTCLVNKIREQPKTISGLKPWALTSVLEISASIGTNPIYELLQLRAPAATSNVLSASCLTPSKNVAPLSLFLVTLPSLSSLS